MSKALQSTYDEIISDFKEQNTNDGPVGIGRLVKEPPFVKSEKDEGLLSWYYTLSEGQDTLIVHLYSYDRCRVNMVQPDGNRVTVTLKTNGEKQEEVFTWLDDQ